MKWSMARAVTLVAILAMAARAEEAPKPPGVAIDHIAASTGIYVGSPSIAILPDGSYLASHDEFGPKSQYHGQALTRVFRSTDSRRDMDPDREDRRVPLGDTVRARGCGLPVGH